MPQKKQPTGKVNISGLKAKKIRKSKIEINQTIGEVGGHKTTYFQTISHPLPRPFTLVIGAAILGILGITVAILVALQPEIVPSIFVPRSFPPAAKDETLIVIATFHRTEGVMDTEAHNEIRRAIQQAAAELKLANFRVEVEPTPLTTEAESEGRSLGQRYEASMVIWGADTGVRVVVNYLNLKALDFDTAKVTISETERTQLANPRAYNKFITSDLPAQLTFLSLFAIGQAYLIREDYPESARIIEEAIDFLPSEIPPPQGTANAYFYLGWLHYEIGKVAQALADYNKAIELDPNEALAYNNRGKVYYEQGQYEQALADYNKAIELDPNEALAYNNRGAVYYDQGQYEQALADYNKAIELDPNEALAYYNRGLVYDDQGQDEQALADYNKAIELEPNYSPTYINRGSVYEEQGQYEQALADFNKVIELDPNEAPAYNNRGNVYYDQGQYEQALADYNKAIELDPNEALTYNNRGAVYYDQGQYEQALADYNKAIELDPNEALSYNNRGVVYYYQAQYEQALADFNKVIELDPNYLDVHPKLCWLGSLLGRAAEVLEICERAVKLALDDQKAIYGDKRGLARALTGDHKGAIEDFEFFMEWMKRNSPELYDQYGPKREAWIAELKAGRNPFDEATLEALLEE